ncbi:EAL domain-containing protein [Conexibacter woesei]|uniref:Diguanylate phosphodiesterase n=1 Tax=Conexibacter woesei (strain DSM 14684 / CCUG 47730 / CIP 108061 / JCM 11494 / NBRC 100937 / ID131577) TaxID=469383 RepID=D3FEG7_CONWI|nr:EAL domain-containing protein [Conexibacter woesei]ADB53659.1 diguanylate phosphodiesterase [Conexibacter woesei DSM 14684]
MARANGGDQAPDRTSGAEFSVSHLIDRRGRCRLAYEPVADLARGVICGYEALARFPEAVSHERWQEAAAQRGLEPDLDAFVVSSVLAAMESLPDDCFLSFNISSEALLRAPVMAVLRRADRLDRLVVELSSSVASHDEQALVEAVAMLRAAGAAIAVDDVGGGYATLRHITVVRPEFVKLDAALVQGLQRDDAKHAMVEAIGNLASQLDAWIVAQGVGEVAELDALIQLRVPLAQGPLIGVRTKTLTRVGFPLAAYVRERGAAATRPSALIALLERPLPIERDAVRETFARAFADDPALHHLPIVDARRCPVGMLERAAFERGEPPAGDVLLVAPSSSIPEVARRAVLRPLATRFHPVICCDVGGRYVGIVRIERLVAALAAARDPRPLATR